ncbi:hypothetical protein I9018_31230 [Pseudomonas sp. MPFS]|uniref:hypothetical protein n=1 Tax=Pseudomonas sp. MPFS TaxID=2795724 RepID=UPI001F13BA80|nr:hypothetical protein [Pseudomonas sp. MPFS]UMZ11890.1 hypothetical protein I9018_31230 [Pseudomonas sp. MPFS]
MNQATFEFSIERYAMYPALPKPYSGADLLPEDFSHWVDAKGDRFCDTFSRICFYLAERYMSHSDSSCDETVIVGTEYGNFEAMLRFQHQALTDHKTLSAQQFPYATTSSASTFINISRHISGGNATLNAGALTPALALLHGLLHIHGRERTKSHVFIGDTYFSEALDDILKSAPTAQVSSGICYLALKEGDQFSAKIRFDESAEQILKTLTPSARIYLDSCSREQLGKLCPPDDSHSDSPLNEHNRAFVFADFLEGVLALKPGQSTALLLAQQTSAASIEISRHHE